VYLGNDSRLKIVGCGRVLIQFPNGKVNGTSSVLHILGFSQNLLSISMLNDMGV